MAVGGLNLVDVTLYMLLLAQCDIDQVTSSRRAGTKAA
jgi:hypothetical protein